MKKKFKVDETQIEYNIEKIIEYKYLKPKKREEFKKFINNEIASDSEIVSNDCVKEVKYLVGKLLNNPFLLEEEHGSVFNNLFNISNYLVKKLDFFITSKCDYDDSIHITEEELFNILNALNEVLKK